MAARKKKMPTSTKQKGKGTRAGARSAVAREPPPRKASSRRGHAFAAGDHPQLFRLNIEVGSLGEAESFYLALFGLQGRRQAGARLYLQAGPVTLQIVDVSSTGAPHPAAKALYFTVNDLDAIHARARSLNALSQESVHGAPGGEPIMRPWGERSFYAEDPWANPLCFVQSGTNYPG